MRTPIPYALCVTCLRGTIALLALCSPVAHGQFAQNPGAFSEAGLPGECYVVRRAEKTGYEKYYSGESFLDPADAPGGRPYDYGSFAMTTKEAAYGDLMGQHKADILCIGDVLTINSALHSNGGNVFILANQLHLNAPIDTRLYFDIANRDRYYRNSHRMPQYDAFFLSYHEKNEEQVKVAERIMAPEMPSGSAIKPSGGPFGGDTNAVPENGTPPPAVGVGAQRALASGSITIFARQIHVSEALKSGRKIGSDVCVASGQEAKPFALQAGGIRGGKGGLGSPSGCSGVSRFCAEENHVNSGRSGPPGQGGPGGDIRIHGIDRTFSAGEAGTIRQASNVDGGAPGPSAIYQTLHAYDLRDNTSTDICQRAILGQHPAAGSGTAGTFDVARAKVAEAVEQLELFVLARDSSPSTDMRDLVQRARSNPNVRYRNFNEFLHARLSHTAMSAERDWALLLADNFAGTPPRNRPSVEPFTGLWAQLDSLPQGISTTSIFAVMQRVASLDIQTSGKPVGIADYFERKGGAFNISNPDATLRINASMVTQDLSEISESTAQAVGALTRLESAINYNVYTARHDTLLATVAELKRRIEELDALARAKSGASLQELAKAIERAAPAIAEFAAAVVSKNYILAAKAFPEAAAGVNDVYNLAFTKLGSIDGKPAMALRGLLTQYEHAMRALYAEYVNEKEVLLVTQEFSAARELAAKHRVATRIESRLPLGEDLIKHSIVSFFLDPSKNRQILVGNLREAAVFLSGRSEYTPVPQLYPISVNCHINLDGSTGDRGCLNVASSTSFQLAETGIGNIRFPAWVIAPKSSRVALSTFGASMRVTHKKRLGGESSARQSARR